MNIHWHMYMLFIHLDIQTIHLGHQCKEKEFQVAKRNARYHGGGHCPAKEKPLPLVVDRKWDRPHAQGHRATVQVVTSYLNVRLHGVVQLLLVALGDDVSQHPGKTDTFSGLPGEGRKTPFGLSWEGLQTGYLLDTEKMNEPISDSPSPPLCPNTEHLIIYITC